MTRMDHRHDDRVRRLMMAALDGESTPDERAELERLLAVDAELMTQWNRLVALKEVTNSMTMKKPPEEVWDRYWTDLYPRLERGIGWILLSLGAVVVVAYGAWEGLRALWYDPELPVLVKGGILVGIVGAAVLLVSVAREKIFLHQSDRYKDILR